MNIIQWANGKGKTIVLTPKEAHILRQRLIECQDTIQLGEDTEVKVEYQPEPVKQDRREGDREMTQLKPTFKDAQQAFEDAIKEGRLSKNPTASNYAGKYMYMGTWDSKDTFKNINTRQYDV